MVTLKKAVAAVTGAAPVLAGMGAWMDSALLSAAGIPTVVFGPRGEGLHGETEWVDLESLTACREITLAAIRDFLRVKGPTPSASSVLHECVGEYPSAARAAPMERSVSCSPMSPRRGTVGKTSAIRSLLGRSITVSAAAMMNTEAPRGGRSRASRAALRHVAGVDIPPQVPPAQTGVLPVRGERGVVLRLHDIGEAQADEGDCRPAAVLAGHFLGEDLGERVARFGKQRVLLVDGRVGRLFPLEGEAERGFTGGPDDPLQPEGGGRGKHVEGVSTLVRNVASSVRRPGPVSRQGGPPRRSRGASRKPRRGA